MSDHGEHGQTNDPIQVNARNPDRLEARLVSNSTDVTTTLDGGTGLANTSGGDDNLAFTLGPGPPAPDPEPVTPTPLTPEPRIFKVCGIGEE